MNVFYSLLWNTELDILEDGWNFSVIKEIVSRPQFS